MRRRLLVSAVTALLVLGGGVASARAPWVPPADTITAVEGTARHGFQVHHYDGPTDYLPTLSEAVAECGEYHDRLRRVRCTAEVRTWYRDLGDTKRALRLARGGG